MLLRELLNDISFLEARGVLNTDIENIQYDSRKVTKGSLFVCIKGYNTNGHDYINKAIALGATALVVQEDLDIHYIEGLTFIRVEDTRRTLATLGKNFHNSPSQTSLSVIGVTGTNGKTSITSFLKEILDCNQSKSGLIGTISIDTGTGIVAESKATTPESLDLQKYFKDMIENNCKYCSMEVSSHSLELNRVDNTEFKIGIFTNLTPDHLDFHKNLNEYRKAKEKLFHKTTLANIINIDDEGGREIYKNIKDLHTTCYTYAINRDADFMAKDVILNSVGVKYTLVTPTYTKKVFIPVPGRFTVYNTLATIAASYLLDIPIETILLSIENTNGVRGRFESISNDKDISVIVDYAHTPDALENILKTAKDFAKNRIIIIFGCGGDRDRSKRPIMGKIAQSLSDICILTSDNPRTENPKKIISDVLLGFKTDNPNYQIIADRELAIKRAIEIAEKDDIVLIAGKGHETYQIIGTDKQHFDDKEIAKKYLT